MCLFWADAVVVNMVDDLLVCCGELNEDVVVVSELVKGRRCCLDALGKSNIPPLFRLLFRGGIVVQQAIFGLVLAF